MTYRLMIVGLGLAVACKTDTTSTVGAGSEGSGTGDSGGATTQVSGDTSTGAPLTGTGSASTTAGAESGTDTGSDTGTGSTVGAESSGGATGTSGGELGCDLAGFAVTTEGYAVSDAGAMDCGTATLEDDLAIWEAISTCASEAIGRGAPFFAAFEYQSIDSTIFHGFAAAQSQATWEVVYDSFGGLNGPQILAHECMNLRRPVNCTVAVGQPCIDCQAPGADTVLCE